MEDSFNEIEFHSIVNPSPTYKKNKRDSKRKPPTKLALKKTLRRSSMYDRLIQSIENSKINMVDAESTESCSYSSSSIKTPPKVVKPRKGFIIINESVSNYNDKQPIDNVIVNDSLSSNESMKKSVDQDALIIESTDDEVEVIPATAENSPVKNVETISKLNPQSLKQNDHLSETKYDSIKNWVQSVARPDDKYSVNAESDKVDNAKSKIAINSTFALDKTCVPFDQWMKDAYKSDRKKVDLSNQPKENKIEKNMPETPNQLLKKYLGSQEVKNILIGVKSPEEKILPKRTSDKKTDAPKPNKTINVVKKPEVKPKKTLVDDKNKENLLKTPNLKHKEEPKLRPSSTNIDDVIITPVKQMINQNDDVASLLDTLYGNSWHKNKDQILTEPRQPKKIQFDKLKAPQTEKNPQHELLYKNPYLDSERQKSTDLLKSLQKQRIQANMESPFFARPTKNKTQTMKGKEITVKDKDEFLSDSSDTETSLADRLKKKHLPKPSQLQFDDSDPKTKTSLILKKKPLRRILVIPDSDSNSDADSFKLKSNNMKSTNSSSSSSSSSNNSGFKKPVRKATQKQKTDKNTDDLADRIENITIDDSSVDSALEIDSDSDDNFIIKPKKGSAIVKTKQKQQQTPKVHSFLASLSKNIPNEQCDPSALIYKTNFKKHRDALTKKLFELFNEKIFDKCIDPETPIEWSTRMTGTAGLCRCMRKTHRDGKVTRTVRLQLSTKVLDSADRLRDTLVHEMCHAATYLINEVSDGHGPYWKSWAAKSIRAFPELPAISRCHDYAINYKYTYNCTSCGYRFGRHSKSLDLERKRCGHCYGKFEVLLNKTVQGGDKKSVPCTPKRDATGFAKFVKDNYAQHKSPGVKHGDLMKLLGKKYAEIKNGKKDV